MFPGSFRQETSRPVPTVAGTDVAAPAPSGRGVSCASSEGHPNAIPIHASKHSSQERPNPQGVRNSIIGFVPSSQGPFEHPREPAQALGSNLHRPNESPSTQVHRSLPVSTIPICLLLQETD